MTEVQASTSSANKFDHLRHDPDFRKFLIDMMDERDGKITASDGQGVTMSKGTGAGSSHAKRSTRNQRGNSEIHSGEEITNEQQINLKKGHTSGNLVKSPSDTTIYTPGLRKMSNEDISLIEKISNFVESIRLDGKNRVSRPVRDSEQQHYSGGNLSPTGKGVKNVTGSPVLQSNNQLNSPKLANLTPILPTGDV